MRNIKEFLVLLFVVLFSFVSCKNELPTQEFYSVTFSLGDGVEGDIPEDTNLYSPGQEVILPDSPARTGYVFICWNDGSTDYNAGSKYVMGNADVIFTAIWAKVYSVTYLLGEDVDGDSPSDSNLYMEGSEFILPLAPSRTDFVFVCWNDGVNDYDAGSKYIMGNKDVIFTAKWDSGKTYSVIYSLGEGINGNEPSDSKKYAEGSSVTLAPAPTRNGFTFLKWTDGANDYDAGEKYKMSNKDVIFIAKWKAWEKVANPVFNKTTNSIPRNTAVRLFCESSGASIFYTINGENPTTSSNLYQDGILITNDCTIKAIAVKTGMNNSDIVTINYSAVYNWYDTPYDVSTGFEATMDSEFVYFGVFPKTVLPVETDIVIDESDEVILGANIYYKGSDNEYYFKAIENLYALSGYSNVYCDGSIIGDGTERYFKVEPIKWRILTTDYNNTGNALLLAEEIINTHPYYSTENEQCKEYDNTYKYSSIRAYLNGTYETDDIQIRKYNIDGDSPKGFLQTAFTTKAQDLIEVTLVDNSPNSTTDINNNVTKAERYSCDNTNDKIFLLSEYEVTNTEYGFPNYKVKSYDFYNKISNTKMRVKIPTDFARAQGCLFMLSSDLNAPYGGFWWLRSPSTQSYSMVRTVSIFGDADNFAYAGEETHSVVPALTILLIQQ